MNILGISCYYHESAAALLVDGKIVAAIAQERLSRNKHDPGFPKEAIQFCLQQAKLKSQDLDWVVFYEKPFVKFHRNLISSLMYFPQSRPYFVESMKNALTQKLWIKSTMLNHLGINPSQILFVPQHLSHAAASFYMSPFDHAAFLTLDAVGEWTTGSWGIARGNKLFPKQEMQFPNSVGMLYSAVTAFLGFEVNDGEYKVMGMAGYGKPKYIDRVRKLYTQYRDGSIKLNLDYFAFQKSTSHMYSDRFIKEFTGLDKFDLAASLQKATEEIIFNLASTLHKRTGEENLAYGGGVALNSVANGKLLSKTGFKNLFIYPAAGDDGGALGAALYVYHHILRNKKRHTLDNVFLGQQYNHITIQSFLKKRQIPYKKMTTNKLVDYVSTALASGFVVGWFEGRSEFGPRALGHRSILADPRNTKMKDIVNSKIKFREEFRPFAPVVLEEEARKYFEIAASLLAPFMLETVQARKRCQQQAPAIVHVDGTSRPQLIDKNYQGNYRKILEAFYKKTGVPILLNTSFNLKGEPIVESPTDAYNMFIQSGLDILVLENYVMEKEYSSAGGGVHFSAPSREGSFQRGESPASQRLTDAQKMRADQALSGINI